MIEQDTIKLLQECNTGIQMGVSSIDEVMPSVKSEKLRSALEDCKKENGQLGDMTHEMLNRYGDSAKEASPIAKGMSWMKTNVKLAVDSSDATVAELITDGCNMAVKSLNGYLNEYEAAEEKAKDIAKRLIKLEEKLTKQVSSFL